VQDARLVVRSWARAAAECVCTLTIERPVVEDSPLLPSRASALLASKDVDNHKSAKSILFFHKRKQKGPECYKRVLWAPQTMA